MEITGGAVYISIKNDILKYFAFSCRILPGMGVENWIYEKLGRPHLKVVGEVLSDVKAGATEIDWITLEDKDKARVPQSCPKRWSKRIVVRGGCDLSSIAHYLKMLTRELVGEFNLYRFGTDIRIDHSEFLRS